MDRKICALAPNGNFQRCASKSIERSMWKLRIHLQPPSRGNVVQLIVFLSMLLSQLTIFSFRESEQLVFAACKFS